jgi:hypothetical protein
MPRVVPSQVVAFIDTIPLPPTEGFSVSLPGVDTAEVSGLADLLDQIPEELLTMDAAAYASFICCKARIRETLLTWAARPTREPDTERHLYSGQANAIRGIREALAKCPDESPAPATSELKFITDTDLRTNLRNDIGAVTRALSNGEWKAATVLAGSAAEALLLWALKQRPPAEITSAITALRATGDLTTKPDPNLDRWNLHEYIEVATNLEVIKPNTAKQTRLAKDFRNFIHPGVAQRLGEKCDRATAFSAVAGMEHVWPRSIGGRIWRIKTSWTARSVKSFGPGNHRSGNRKSIKFLTRSNPCRRQDRSDC